MAVAQYMFSVLIGEILGGLACLSFDFRQVFIDLGQFFTRICVRIMHSDGYFSLKRLLAHALAVGGKSGNLEWNRS